MLHDDFLQMDDSEKSFLKMKRISQNIVRSGKPGGAVPARAVC